jgi:hypothetical protein
LKKKTKISSNRLVSVRFFGQKLVQTGLARFFQFGFFLVWLGFFSGFFGLGSVRFFWFQAYKTEPVSFFKILISFFYDLVFSIIFFLIFSI